MRDRTWRRSPPPRLPAKLQALLDQPWPRFSDAEMARRRAALEAVMAARDVAHLLIYGAANSGTAVPWVCGWPVTTEAACVMSPGARDALYVQYYNHLPLARRETPNADVGWGGASTIATVAEEIRRRGGARKRIGVIGPLPFSRRDALADATDAERSERVTVRAVEVSRDRQTGHDFRRWLCPIFSRARWVVPSHGRIAGGVHQGPDDGRLHRHVEVLTLSAALPVVERHDGVGRGLYGAVTGGLGESHRDGRSVAVPLEVHQSAGCAQGEVCCRAHGLGSR